MATLYISEYARVVGLATPEPPIAEQTVAIGGGSLQSSAFQATTRLIRVHNDAICSVLVGANPTVTTAKKRLPIDSVEWFAVKNGHKLAVIANT